MSAAAFVLYPFVAGFAFFFSPPDDLGLTIVRLTLVAFVLFGYLYLVPNSIGLLTSADVDEKTRAQVLVGSSTGLISTTLYLGLAFWAFGPQQARSLPGSVPLAISLQLLVVLIAFFALSTLVPYAIGVIAARRRRAELFGRERKWLNKISRTLRTLDGSSWRAQLDGLRQVVEEDALSIARDDIAIQTVEEVADDPPQELRLIVAGYRTALETDPRFVFRSHLYAIADTINKIVADLEDRRSSAARDKQALRWSEVLNEQSEELEEESKKASEGVPKAGFAVAAGTAVFMVLLQEMTKTGWDAMVAALNR
jgi:hypothetical protein